MRDKGVVPYDTKDEEGRERFHPFTPGGHYKYRKPKNNPDADWYPRYTIDLKFGLDCCSPSSATFHYVDPKLMYRIEALLYNLC